MPDIQGPDQEVYRDSYSVDFDPIRGTWYFKIEPSGEILEVDAIVERAEAWERRSESKDPNWKSLRFGALVVAVKTFL